MEMHHRGKVDAPSGTALALGRAAAAGRGVAFEQVEQRARDGITGPRRAGDIGFAALRGGDAVGDHHVIFAGAGERLELDPPGDQPRDLRQRRRARRALGGRAAAGALRPEGGAGPLSRSRLLRRGRVQRIAPAGSASRKRRAPARAAWRASTKSPITRLLPCEATSRRFDSSGRSSRMTRSQKG